MIDRACVAAMLALGFSLANAHAGALEVTYTGSVDELFNALGDQLDTSNGGGIVTVGDTVSVTVSFAKPPTGVLAEDPFFSDELELRAEINADLFLGFPGREETIGDLDLNLSSFCGTGSCFVEPFRPIEFSFGDPRAGTLVPVPDDNGIESLFFTQIELASTHFDPIGGYSFDDLSAGQTLDLLPFLTDVDELLIIFGVGPNQSNASIRLTDLVIEAQPGAVTLPGSIWLLVASIPVAVLARHSGRP